MSGAKVVYYASGILIAVGLSNMITLAIYYSGHPMAALIASVPVGLTIGVVVGLVVQRVTPSGEVRE